MQQTKEDVTHDSHRRIDGQHYYYYYYYYYPPGLHQVGGCHQRAASSALIDASLMLVMTLGSWLAFATTSRSLRISSHCCSAIVTSCWLELVNVSTSDSRADVFPSKRDTSTGNCRHDVLVQMPTMYFPSSPTHSGCIHD